MEEASCIYESAVGDPTGVELAVVAPTGARLEVVVAEVGLVEAALVGPAAAEVEFAAAEASLQLALHRMSDSFYTEASTRYHCIFQSLSFAACSSYHFYLSMVAASYSFYHHAQLFDSELLMTFIFISSYNSSPLRGWVAGATSPGA